MRVINEYKWIFLGELPHSDVLAWCDKHDVAMSELAQMLGLSDTYFYNLARDGYMPTVRNFVRIVDFCDLNPLSYFGIERVG